MARCSDSSCPGLGLTSLAGGVGVGKAPSFPVAVNGR